MKKRIVATLVWSYAAWTAANMVTYAFDWAVTWGPIVAVATGLVVGLDPLHWIWDRTSTAPTRASSTQEPARA